MNPANLMEFKKEEQVSDFSREARAYCRQHGIYFYPNDAGCEQCERDMENMDGDSLENCVCDNEEGEELEIICDKYDNSYSESSFCFRCGHTECCHENT